MAERRVNATRKGPSILLENEKLQLDYYAYTTPESQQHWEVSAVLPPDARDGAIVVGGGGWAQGHETSAGAFLTCSCPTRDLDGWVVASKDHAEATDAHQLSVYLLALRIEGMRRDDLRRVVQIFEAHSAAPQAYPTAEVLVEASHAVLSGGFWVDWHGEGNLATASFPNAAGNGWIAKSKEHIKSSPATISAYAIGIKKILPGAVSVVPHIDQATSSRAAHPTMEVSLNPVYLLTGAGAQVHWGGEGNMLTRIEPIVDGQPRPVVQNVRASAKDHVKSDPSTVTVYAVGAILDEPFKADRLAGYVQGLAGAGV
jgi:hypothetical protein